MYNELLKTFLTVVDTGSFSKASQHLYISTVAVSKQINQLEDIVGVRLLQRSPRGVSLTTAGTFFAKQAQSFINTGNNIIRQTQQIADTSKVNIRVGSSLMRPAKLLLDQWAASPELAQKYDLSLVPFDDDPKSIDQVFQQLGNTIDLFVGPYNYSMPNYGDSSFFHLFDYPCECGVPITNPLVKKEQLTINDLNQQHFALLKKGLSPKLDQLRQQIKLKSPHIKIIDVDTYYDTDVFNQALNHDFLIETLPIWKNVHPGIVNKPIDWDITMPYGIIYSSNASQVVRKFIEKIGNQLREKNPLK